MILLTSLLVYRSNSFDDSAGEFTRLPIKFISMTLLMSLLVYRLKMNLVILLTSLLVYRSNEFGDPAGEFTRLPVEF
jgi:hypothetical protein